MTVHSSADAIVDFWRRAGPEKWFAKSDAFDGEIRERFEAAHHAAARGELHDWLDAPQSALALILLLDQFPRNLYRNSAHAFATDGLALWAAEKAIAREHDQQAEQKLRGFYYLPFEHSERPEDQARSVKLFDALGDAEYLEFARLHADIIARFGRFPHRNKALGRASTPEEEKFLDEGGFAG